MSTQYCIRNAVKSDANQLSKLAERTFRTTFARVNSEENMQDHCSNSYSEKIQFNEISSPNIITLVVENKSELIAYAQLHKDKSPECIQATRPIEIRRFYVDAEWHGKKIAQSLMNKILRCTDSLAADIIWLGVWELNPRAITFYKKWGFKEVGDHCFYLGADRQRDLIFSRVA